MSSINLLNCVKSIYNPTNQKQISNIENCRIENLKDIFKEIYKRIIIPFYIPLFVLITFILILSSKENINYNKLKFLTFFLGFFFIIFSETTIRLVSENLSVNLYISIIPYLSFFILYFYLFKKLIFKF